ncbi:hypothetical protein [Paraburkholderia unamae]|uniref:Uncharacterized protein n=1 Tax=Paraburkholderia unamae TaxID=219649 RepID=A0ABX5KIE9_9BURK|nr:hypothetical protein [Paraburkholderia unamae]PVX77186.1 hypothetical protein C7402_115245 [Paraburkholderia unamae]
MTVTATRACATDARHDQARAIREHHEKREQAPKESARDARLRMQIERERKERPMTGGK